VTRARGERANDLLGYGGAAMSLALAAIVYVGSRSGLRLHAWVSAVVGRAEIDALRARASALPPWVRFSLPDALWQLAFCLVVFRIWHGESWTIRKIAWCAAPIVIGVGLELGQAAGLVAGTFDWADLAGTAIATVVAAIAVRGLPISRAALRVSDDGRLLR
jgi:hypothetical protein